MKYILLLMFFLPIACAELNSNSISPIDALVKRLNETYGMWINGLYPDIKLPSDSKPEEVLAEAVKIIGFDSGHIKSYKIKEIRTVKVNSGEPEDFKAILIDSDLGEKILIFKPERNNEWWTRFYDAKNFDNEIIKVQK